MKRHTSTSGKTVGVLVCLTPVLLMAAVSNTDAFDVSGHFSGVEKDRVISQNLPEKRATRSPRSDVLATLDLLQLGGVERDGQIVDQDISLIEKEWIFRFTNRHSFDDQSIDCHISSEQKDKISDLTAKIKTSPDTLSAGQFELARVLRNSRGEDCQRLAFELFQKSADLGYGRAFAEIANAYKKGLGVDLSFARSLEFFEKSARLGFANSAYRLIQLTEKGGDGVAGDAAKASRYLEEFLPLIEAKIRQGDAVAARSLGRLYNNSNLLQLDTDKAIRFMEYAANLGDPIAMHDLVLLRVEHRRKEVDGEDVYRLLLESSRLGYGAAFTAMGRLHLKGEFGFLKREAARWFRSGVDAGHPGAMSELASLYFRGDHVVRDRKIAKDLAVQGARLNHLGAKRVLNEILEWEENQRAGG